MKYEIKGGNLPVVICTLQSGEAMITESGAMSWMSSNMKMETGAKGGLGGAFGRMFSGESIFQNRYTAHGGEGLFNTVVHGPGHIILQTMPISAVAGCLSPFFPSGNNN